MGRIALGSEYRLVVGTHALTVSLAPHVAGVRGGTPMYPTERGWDVCTNGQPPEGFAGGGAQGGERVAVFRTLTVGAQMGLDKLPSEGPFVTGRKYGIVDIQWHGQPVFEEQKAGPYIAVSAREITLDVAATGGRQVAAPEEDCSPSWPPAATEDVYNGAGHEEDDAAGPDSEDREAGEGRWTQKGWQKQPELLSRQS